ncbi:MAG: helix-turn-helix transcriptional regulator [Caulobacterales bacterium]|nr:helix-turn-helix transcriptional regulator [Caulobacterales bacterium]
MIAEFRQSGANLGRPVDGGERAGLFPLWMNNQHEHKSAITRKRLRAIDRHIGARVRMRRLRIGMSQDQLGEKLGVTFQQVQKYERGANRISPGRLWLISEVLDVPVSYFFFFFFYERVEAEAPHPTPDDIERFIQSPGGGALAKSWISATQSNLRKALLSLIRSIEEVKKEG